MINGYNTWGSLSPGGLGSGAQSFGATLGQMPDPPKAVAPAKKGGAGFDIGAIDPVMSLATRGTWKGPGGEWKDGSEQNQFLDLRGGGRPMFNHHTFGMNWGQGSGDQSQPEPQYGTSWWG